MPLVLVVQEKNINVVVGNCNQVGAKNMGQKTPLRIAIVAGEYSGDVLGAHLIRALQKKLHMSIECYGIAGTKMIQAG